MSAAAGCRSGRALVGWVWGWLGGATGELAPSQCTLHCRACRSVNDCRSRAYACDALFAARPMIVSSAPLLCVRASRWQEGD
jgi:hypothetical protein